MQETPYEGLIADVVSEGVCSGLGAVGCDRRVFFFKQRTAYEVRISDWSSDVCSSDLEDEREVAAPLGADGVGDEPGDELVGQLGEALHAPGKIGRASCRERVCQYV